MMNLVKWNPWGDAVDFRNQINRMFNDCFHPDTDWSEKRSTEIWNPAVDIYEEGQNLVIKAELPGISKDDIAVDMKDRVLTIKGQRHNDQEVKQNRYYRRERMWGKFERAFSLPDSLDADNIRADFADGVLKVSIPKSEDQKPKKITVQ